MVSKGKNNKVATGAGPAAAGTPGQRAPEAAGNVAATDSGIRTPWGCFKPSADDHQAKDPFEPEPPLTPAQVAARSIAGPRLAGSAPAEGKDVAALTPRELFEMMMGPAAQPTRSSPLRHPAADAPPAVNPAGAAIPAEAELILSALEAGRASAAAKFANRRGQVRRPYRVAGALRLFSDAPSVAPWVLYTRDIHSRGLGFITPHRLPLGYGGMLEMPDPCGNSKTVCIPCTLLRCREAAPGWFEGSLYFNREQPAFDKV